MTKQRHFKHCVKESFARGGGITTNGIYNQRLQFMCKKLLGGGMLKAFLPCMLFLQKVLLPLFPRLNVMLELFKQKNLNRTILYHHPQKINQEVFGKGCRILLTDQLLSTSLMQNNVYTIATTQPTTQSHLKQLMLVWYYYR